MGNDLDAGFQHPIPADANHRFSIPRSTSQIGPKHHIPATSALGHRRASTSSNNAMARGSPDCANQNIAFFRTSMS